MMTGLEAASSLQGNPSQNSPPGTIPDMVCRIMFANFTPLSRRRRPDEEPFVESVDTLAPISRNPSVEKLLVWGWLAIVAKSVFVIWAWRNYPIPFHPAWLIGPSVAFGLLCTVVYWWRVRR